jgi:hypothetical protein
MTGQIIRIEPKGTRARGRHFAIVAAFVAAVALAGQAAILAMTNVSAPAQKSAARLDAGPIEKRELVFSLQDLAVDESLRAFRPGPAWSPEPAPPVAMVSPVAAVAAAVVVAPPAVVLLKTSPRVKLAAATPLPPARPLGLAHRPQVAAATPVGPAPEGPATFAGVQLPRFVPTGADILGRIGAVGSSLGKLMRVSSR